MAGRAKQTKESSFEREISAAFSMLGYEVEIGGFHTNTSTVER